MDAEDVVSAEARVMFSDNVIGSGGDTAVRRIALRKDGGDTIQAVKGKIAVQPLSPAHTLFQHAVLQRTSSAAHAGRIWRRGHA